MTQDYHSLNAMLNLYGEDGEIQFDKDKEAARQYFLQHVNQNTVFFHSLEEKLDYLVENEYYEKEVLDQYDRDYIKDLYKYAYSFKFRFQTFLGAFKCYTSYTLKTFDGQRYLERFEDRVAMTALFLARGDETVAWDTVRAILTGAFQPATPTFLNAGKKQRGELVSCFLLGIEDDLESIGRAINSSLQLSKRGGGVALALTNIREQGAPIKKIEGQSSGVVPVMKLLEDSFSYANQLGSRAGAGAVYLHACHPDIMTFLDTKRENADEKIRIKTLSLGVVMPDIAFELARGNKDMYLFSPYDVLNEYGVTLAEIGVTEKYHEMAGNPNIRKSKVNARELFKAIAELQFESGYPYIMFEDTVNYSNTNAGRIVQSNLCVSGDTEILTSEGYRRADDLYETQEDFKVIVDERARTMDIDAKGTSVQSSTRMFKTAEGADIYKVVTKEGFELKATEWHKMYVERGGEVVKIPLAEVEPLDKILVQGGANVTFGSGHNPDLAYIAGVMAAEGTFGKGRGGDGDGSAIIWLYGEKAQFIPAVESAIHKALIGREDLLQRQATLQPVFKYNKKEGRWGLTSRPLAKLLSEYGVTAETKVSVPGFVKNGDRQTQQAFLNGAWQMDGSVTGSVKHNVRSIEMSSIDRGYLQDVQKLLLGFGVYTRLYNANRAGVRAMPDGNGGVKDYDCRATWSLRANNKESFWGLFEMVDWLDSSRAKGLEVGGSRVGKKPAEHKYRATVESINFEGVGDVYDVTVENGHSVIFNGIATGNCSEILQSYEPSSFNEDLSYSHVGMDISCNLGSLNIANAFNRDLGAVIETAVKALSSVADQTDIQAVPSIARANRETRSIGLGQMNLHGFLAKNHIHYDSPEAVDFTSAYFAAVAFHSLSASMRLCRDEGLPKFRGFEKSTYADGRYFDKYVTKSWQPKTDKVKKLFADNDVHVPTIEDWERLKNQVMEHGIYNSYLQAVPPTGSISYINNSTSSIHPIASKVEIRKEGRIGRVYYPAPFMTNDNLEYYKDAYEIGPEAIIDVYAAAQEHVDQGLSLTLFFKDTATTRDINRAQIYAWRKGIKTLYYIRVRQQALEGTETADCVSCML